MCRTWICLTLVLAGLCSDELVLAADEPKQPVVVAHRGLLKHAPENTMANFRACIALGMGFEFDVARTKDGYLVVIHDDTVDRTTNGTGKVAEMTLHEIRQLDAGNWFDARFLGEKVPTVDEVLALIAQSRATGMIFAADLKAVDVEKDTVLLADKHQVTDRLVFIGRTITSESVRGRIRQINPQANTAVVVNNPGEFENALVAPQANWVYFRFVPNLETVDRLKKSGKQSFIAGVTVSGIELSNWKQCREVGLNAVLTDFPLEFLEQGRKK